MWRCCLPCVGCFCVFVCLVLDCVRSCAVDIWYDGVVYALIDEIVYARVQKAPVICWSLDFEAKGLRGPDASIPVSWPISLILVRQWHYQCVQSVNWHLLWMPMGLAFASRDCGWHLEGAQLSPGGVKSSPGGV